MSESNQQDQAIASDDRFNSFIICDEVSRFTKNMYYITLDKEFIFVTKCATYCTTAYKENCVLLTDCDEQNIISLLKIKAIFINKSYEKAIFYGKLMKMFYNATLLLYENQDEIETSYGVAELHRLLLSKPIQIFEKKKKQYFSPISSHICD